MSSLANWAAGSVPKPEDATQAFCARDHQPPKSHSHTWQCSLASRATPCVAQKAMWSRGSNMPFADLCSISLLTGALIFFIVALEWECPMMLRSDPSGVQGTLTGAGDLKSVQLPIRQLLYLLCSPLTRCLVFNRIQDNSVLELIFQAINALALLKRFLFTYFGNSKQGGDSSVILFI